MRHVLAVAALLVATAAAAEDLYLSLEAALPEAPDLVTEAAPKRFVLLEDGSVYVGGTQSIAAGRLEKGELKALGKRLEKVRKTPGLGASVTFGEGAARYRLVVAKGKPLDVVASGDPATAPAALRGLAGLIAELATFQHPSLRAYKPASYALRAREASLPGGCRSWSFPVRVEQAVAAAQRVPAAEAAGWPTGAQAASVCVDDRRYAVTLRPLLPDERP
ncbi:MAG TPA: hypothetical protein VFM88_12490 [Vicinamibacteria bacterium]|nr:hypothetical protein [Vicinamibacteria bacterium]